MIVGEPKGASNGCLTTKPSLLSSTNACRRRWWSSLSPAPGLTATARFPVGPRPTLATPSADPAETATMPMAAATTRAVRPASAGTSHDPLDRAKRMVVLGPSFERPFSTETTRSAPAPRAAWRAVALSGRTTVVARPGRTE